MNRFRQKKICRCILWQVPDMQKFLSVRERFSDLVVGNSKVELVVAEQKACALVSYQEDMAEKVRVLLKNGKENTYASLFVAAGMPIPWMEIKGRRTP